MPYKILIVEDDENIAKYIHTCLSQFCAELCQFRARAFAQLKL